MCERQFSLSLENTTAFLLQCINFTRNYISRIMRNNTTALFFPPEISLNVFFFFLLRILCLEFSTGFSLLFFHHKHTHIHGYIIGCFAVKCVCVCDTGRCRIQAVQLTQLLPKQKILPRQQQILFFFFPPLFFQLNHQ